MKDDFDRIRRGFDTPEVRALLSAAAIAGFFAYAGSMLANPKRRKNYFEQVRKAGAERRERDAWRKRDTERIRARWAYFNEQGDKLWAERALITVGPEKPFPDAVFERLPAGFRHARFAIQSRKAGAKLTMGYDVADRTGGLNLIFDDGRKWSLGITTGNQDVAQYQASEILPDIEMARLACRLMATPDCPFSTITLIRPESREIREQIWRDHLAQHPELEREPWPFR